MKTSLSRNVAANILQMIASAFLMLLFYRYVTATIGMGQLGIWSVVLSTVSSSRLAELGLGSGVVRFAGRALARADTKEAAVVIDTVTITLMTLLAFLLPALYPVLKVLLSSIFDAHTSPDALSILPLALVSLWLTIVSSIFQGGLDACQRLDIRAAIQVFGQLIFFIAVVVMTEWYGLRGLAAAQVIQGLFMLVVGRILLCRKIKTLAFLPRRWSLATLREMLGYGINLQIGSMFMLLVDPLTKALLARFGGPDSVGYFEVANQVTLKPRAFIIAANQATIPKVVELWESERDAIQPFYEGSVRGLIFATLPMFVMLYVTSHWISVVMIGTDVPQFVTILKLLTLAWGFNIITASAYYINIGTGHVRWNTLSHIAMGGFNLGIGWLLGTLYGADGVVWSYALALVLGSLIVFVQFNIHHSIGLASIFLREHLYLFISCLGAISVSQCFYSGDLASTGVWAALGMLVPIIPLLYSVWRHPVRRLMWGQLTTRRG